MKRSPMLNIIKNVTSLGIYRGETITLWLCAGERDKCNEDTDRIQVEIRVTNDDKPQIFCNHLEVTSFKQWYSDEEG